MALTTVYTKRNTLRYMATTCSSALLFHWITVAVMVILPFIAAFYTRNLWVSELTYREQPDVQFKYKLISLIHTADETYLWSTYPSLNTMAQDMLAVPSLSVAEHDLQRDGKLDQLNLTLHYTTTNIVSVQLVVFVQYQLSDLCNMVMESALFVQQTVLGDNMVIQGDLELVQREVLKAYNTHNAYNTPLVTEDMSLESYQLSKILSSASSRTLSTRLSHEYALSGPGEEGLTLSLIINVQDQLIRYEPGFWEALKYAWIQYLALFIIVYTITQQLRSCVFENMIVITLPQAKDSQDKDQ